MARQAATWAISVCVAVSHAEQLNTQTYTGLGIMIGAIGCLPESPDASQWIVFKVWLLHALVLEFPTPNTITVGAGLGADAGAVVV